MPPPKSAPTAKSKLKQGKGFITRKVGPLPVWGWAALVVVAVALFLLLRKKPADTGGDPGPLGMAALPPDGAFSGQPPGATPPAQGLDPDLVATFRSAFDNEIATLMDYHGKVNDLEDQWGAFSAQTDARWGEVDQRFYTVEQQVAAIPDMVTQAVAATAAARPVPAPAKGSTTGGKKPAAPVKKQAPVKYYTYKPGKAPAGKKAQAAPAKAPPGKKLKFQKGKGYYYG